MVIMSENQDIMGPEFYKIVHASLNTTQHLTIPPDFVKHISETECGIAVIEGPSGNIWRVKYEKQEDGSFLQDGWGDFVRDHSLGNFEFLLFRYDGALSFNVQIFDKSACEKEDSFYVEPHQKPVVSHEREAMLPKECEVVDHSSRRHVRGRPPKETPVEVVEVVEHAAPRARPRGRPRKNSPFSIQGRGRVPGRRFPTSDEVERVWKHAKAFKSNFPYFSRSLNASSVYMSFVLNLPREFAYSHFPNVKTSAVLKNHEGKSWTVNFIPETKTFCGGWSGFVVDNQLEAGDICIFELVGKLEFCVHIFRCEID